MRDPLWAGSPWPAEPGPSVPGRGERCCRGGRERAGQGGWQGMLREICLKQPPKRGRGQREPTLVGVRGVGDAPARRSTAPRAGASRQIAAKELPGREGPATATLPAGFFFAFPNGSFPAMSCLLPLPGSTWLQRRLGGRRRLRFWGRGCARVRLCCVGCRWGPRSPPAASLGAVAVAGGWQHPEELCWARQGPLLEAASEVPPRPRFPGGVRVCGSLSDPSRAVGVPGAEGHPLPGALPPCVGAAGSSGHRLPHACPLPWGRPEP